MKLGNFVEPKKTEASIMLRFRSDYQTNLKRLVSLVFIINQRFSSANFANELRTTPLRFTVALPS